MGDFLHQWLAENRVPFGALLGTFIIVVAGILVASAINRGLHRLFAATQHRVPLGYGIEELIRRVATTAVWIQVVVLVFSVWGVGAGGLWTSLVSVAALIGAGFLTTWMIISNVTAAFFLTIWRPFHLGDDVELLPENLQGHVADRNLMFTTLVEAGGTRLQVPNNLFFQKIFRVTDAHPDRGGLRMAAPEGKARQFGKVSGPP